MAESKSRSHKAGGTPPDGVEAFIARWAGASGSESANYGLFVQELCRLLGVPEPDPASEDTRDNAYVFQRRVTFRHGDGSESYGFIDCYRRDAFVLEAKKFRKLEGKAFNDAMLRARGQAELYARSLPAAEGRPPFLVIVDVGNVIELYSEFTRSGATYTPFPDPRSHRIRLDDLPDEGVRKRLRQVWFDPLSLDPSRRSSKVTREVAEQLATIAYNLERSGHAPETVAGFLTRCLFSMFAEDVGLLPKRAFINLLEKYREDPGTLQRMLAALWREMNDGGFSAAIAADVLRFNGKIFKDQSVLLLSRDQIALLLEAAMFDWKAVEPAIFGTLFERALDPEERHKLGGHYTPRAYVERLVLPTVVEPLREDWKNAQAAALLLAAEGKLQEARDEIHAFHHKLCEVRVLDPACGSGNFLYVTLEHLKRLEGEVLNQLEELGEGQERFEAAGITVDPHQLRGIEINPRAAAITELVLWIGYLQWHFRTRGNVMPPQPVLKDFHNIECRDAVLAYDRMEYVTDERGVPVTRWDGKTYKKNPVTGEDIPDEAAQVPVERYINPRRGEWPAAEFVVGNPPFIGSKRMREALGDGYVDALQAAWPEIPQATDLVVRWWHFAAELTRQAKLRRFGLIATNSLRQAYVRRAIEPHLAGEPPLSIVFAIPDHPWVDTDDGAAVRICMTVGERGLSTGRLLIVTREHESSNKDSEDLVAEFRSKTGRIQADLSVGPEVSRAQQLRSNERLCSVGMKTIGAAFQIGADKSKELGLGTVPGVERHIRPYLNGRDFASSPRGIYVIDFFGLKEIDVRERFPAAYQHLLNKAKPERLHNRNKNFRELWWVIGHPRQQFREAIGELQKFIATIETSKHRFFAFIPSSIVPDSTLVTFAFGDALALGVLSTYTHVVWALAAGGRLGVGNDPRYNKTRCFETFPFPVTSEAQQSRIRSLADQLDIHRKRQQTAHADLTPTGMYNVLEKLMIGETLNPTERVIHEQGLVSVLKQLHDELDLAVLEAYGWSDLAPLMQVVNGNAAPGLNGTLATRDECKRALDDALLERLVALNAVRVAEEKKGLIRWLRPEFQNPGKDAVPKQAEIEIEEEAETKIAAKAEKRRWPKELPDQVRQVADVLAAAREPMSLDAIAEHFTGKGPWKRRLPQIVETLESLGRARRVGDNLLGMN